MKDKMEIFKAIFEQIHNACVVYDPDAGKFIMGNSAFRLLFGQKAKAEFSKDDFLAALHPGFSEQAFEDFLHAPLAGRVSHTRQRLIQNGKPGIDFEISAERLNLPDGSLILLQARKTSETAQFAGAQPQGVTDTNVLARLIRSISETRDLQEGLNIVCRELAVALDIPQAALAIVNENGEFFEVQAEYSVTDNPSALGDKIPVLGNSATEYVVQQKKAIYIADVCTDERMKLVHDVMERRGIVSMLIVPLIVRDSVVGTLGLDTLKRREFSEDEIQLVENALEVIGPLIELTQIYRQQPQELKQKREIEKALAIRERFLAALVEIQIVLLSIDNPDEVYEQILRVLGEASGADRAYLFFNHESEEGDLVTSQKAEWTGGNITAQINNPNLQNMSYSGALKRWFDVLSRGIYLVGKVVDFPQEEQDLLLPQDILSILVLPILSDGKFLGFVGFDNCTSERSWTVSEITMLKSAASSIALSEERRQAESVLALQRDFALSIMNNMGQGLMVTNAKGQFEFVNPALGALLHCETGILLSKTLQEISVEEDRKTVQNAFRKMDTSGEVQTLEIRLRRLDGEVVYALITKVPLMRDDMLSGSIIVVTDLTQRRQIVSALRRSEEFMRELYTISSAVPATFSEKLEALLHMGCQHFGLDTGVLSQIKGTQYKVIKAYPEHGDIRSGMKMELDKTFCSVVMKNERPISFHHASIDELWADRTGYENVNIKSFLGGKLIVAGEVFGTLSFFSTTPKDVPFMPADEEFLRLMAQWIGTEIEREQYLHQLRVNTDEIAEKNEELAKARDQALEVSRLKSEFLATMSHEIRTPMNAVIGMTDLLLGTDLTTEQNEYANLIQDSAQMLLTILNDILDFSKIEAGKLTLENAVFECDTTIKSVVNLFSQKAAEKELSLNLDISPDVPPLLIGDAIRLKQVLSNLIGNAIKFTTEGHIEVKVEVKGSDWKQVELRCEVSDTGIGILEDVQKELFQAFMQADSSTTRKYGGTGLGLAISKRLVESMGGEIGLESTPDEGSVFWFTAIFDRTGKTNLLNDEELIKRLGGTQVLLVSENVTFSQYLQQQFLPWKMTIIHASEWDEAKDFLLQAIEEKEPILTVLVDNSVGDEAAEVVKDLEIFNWKIKPVWALLPEKDGGENPHAPLYERIFPRPVHVPEIVEFIASLVKQHDLPEPQQLSPAEPEKPISVKIKPLSGRILVAEDNIANQRLAFRQLKKLGYEVEIATDGKMALELIREFPDDFAVVLMDCQMPVVDGFEATRQLRTLEAETGRHRLVIAMTANAMIGDREMCIEAGMDDYISKPVKMDDLHAVLQKWHANALPVNKPDELTVEKYEADELLNMETIQSIRELQGEGEPDLFAELVDIFLAELERLFGKAHQAVQEADAEAYRQVMHSVKGSSSNLGVDLLSSKAAELESQVRGGNFAEAAAGLELLEEIYKQSCAALDSVK